MGRIASRWGKRFLLPVVLAVAICGGLSFSAAATPPENRSGLVDRPTLDRPGAEIVVAASTRADRAVLARDGVAKRVAVDAPASESPRDGSLLRAGASGIPGQGDVVGFEWERCDAGGDACLPIEGTEWPEYVPNPSDVGSTLRVRVSVENPGGQVSVVRSAASSVVLPSPPSRAAGPAIFGSDAGGQLLALGELWYGTPPFDIGYQWLQCDTAGDGCKPILGATSERYWPTKADAKAGAVVVEVTATNAAGSAVERSRPFVFRPEFVTLGLCDQNPVNTELPTISPSGSAEAGATIYWASAGTWSPSVFQCNGVTWTAWFCSSGLLRDDQANNQPYTTSTSNIGCTIQLQETPIWTSGGQQYASSARSAATLITAPPPPPNYQPDLMTPAGPAGATTPSNGGGIYAKYSDPGGQPGTETVSVYRYGTSTLLSQKTFTVASGDYPPMYMDTPFTGHVLVHIEAKDNLGQPALHYIEFDMWATYVPATPTLDSPFPNGIVTTTNPVLRASTSDVDNDRFGISLRISSVANCSGAQGPEVLDQSPLLATVPTGSPLRNVATYRLPERLIKDSATYYWCAQGTDTQINWGSPDSGWSASQAMTLRLPSLGVSGSWPLWQRGPLAVNEATGNLVVALPGPSYPTGIGDLTVSAVYNSLDTRGNLSGLGPKWLLGTAGNVPVKLLDHSLYTGNEAYDGIERINADGSSSYYAHVGSATSGLYRSIAGDLSQLNRNADNTWTLTDVDGSTYTYASGALSDKSYRLSTAEVAVGKTSQANLLYSYDASGRIDLIEAKMSGTTVSTLDFNWACTGALVCITGPDGRTWKYVGDASNRLVKVTLCWSSCTQARDLARVSYPAGDLIGTYESANDIADDTTVLGTKWRSAHKITIAYGTGNRVSSVSEAPIRRDVTGSAVEDLSPVWSFTYSTGGGQTLTGARVAHAASGSVAAVSAGSTRPAAGYTDMCPPRQQTVCATTTRVYYDALFQPLEVRNLAGGISLVQYDSSGRLVWSEDEQGKATDVTYDAVTGLATKTEGPDPDGTGAAFTDRLRSSYRYDETKVGTPSAAGPLLNGLQAAYYNNQALSGRPVVLQTDGGGGIDFTWTGAPATGVRPDGFSVRWRGYVDIAATGTYKFSTVASGGSRLYLDGMQIIDGFDGQGGEICSGPITQLAQGKHAIVLEYRDFDTVGAVADIELRLSTGSGCADGGTADGPFVAGSQLFPGYGNQQRR